MVTVKLFGTFRLDSGLKELQLEAGSVKDIFPLIMDEVRRLDPQTELTMKDLKSCVVSLNGRQVGMRAALNDGDLVILVPAVAGG
ncbi:MAG: MoaD/ThiS family protein [Oscillospiraceae bacterium]|nr:MoaD/ThiS family protein [Oscillospiraceae bacterium]